MFRLLAVLAVGSFAFVSTACSGVWIQNKDKSKDPTLYLYSLTSDVKETDTYKALKRDDVLAAVSSLEASLKNDPNAYQDRRILSILYRICDEKEMAVKLLKDGIDVANAKNDTSAKSSLQHELDNIEHPTSKH
jgi:hypothetical protein